MICGKLCFKSRSKAAKAMATTIKRRAVNSRRDATKPSVYFCEDCQAYHWGHLPIKLMKGTRARRRPSQFKAEVIDNGDEL